MAPAMGMVVPFTDGPGVRDAGKLAEELGFDILAVGEHVMMPTPITAAFTSLSFLAGITHRVRLLSSIALAPLYPPPLLAKLVHSLDRLSEGRLDLGLGVGGEFPGEFEACGVPVTERGARLDELLDVLQALAEPGSASFEGRFTRFESGQVKPGPRQRPYPPIWIAGRSDAALARAARRGDVWMPYLVTPEQLSARVALLERKAAEAGRAGRVGTAVFCWLAVHRDGAEARRRAAAFVGRVYRQDFTGRAGRLLVAGTPAECARRLSELVDAGGGSLILCPAQPPDAEFLATVELLGREVLPAVTSG